MFTKRKLLFVEDDQQEIVNISKFLRSLKIDYFLATSIDQAIAEISKQAFDFLLTDLHIETKAGFERPDGLLVIQMAKEQHPNITIVATSSDPRSEIWNEALAAGAHNFIRKPISKNDEITIAFGLARDRRIMVTEAGKSGRKNSPAGRWNFFAEGYPYGIVISQKEFKRARGIATKKDANFVIMGETGTGKEEIARLIHRMRIETEGTVPFVAINCATITGNLVESLMFGHKKGAFTGAEQATTGFVGDADGGILFLDEIQTLDISTQQKLLRVLNDGTYCRLGETKTYRSQFQLIAASTKDLDDEVEAGRFLIDIRTRLMGLDMKLSPLRERQGDIPAFIALFLSKKNIEISDKTFKELSAKLMGFYWAGNIRQLMKALDAWILTCEFDEIPLTVENFPVFKGMNEKNEISEIQSISDMSRDFSDALRKDVHLESTVGSYERAIIEAAIIRHKTIGDSCKALGLSRSSFDVKRRKHGIF